MSIQWQLMGSGLKKSRALGIWWDVLSRQTLASSIPSFGRAFHLCGATNIHGNLLSIGRSPCNKLRQTRATSGKWVMAKVRIYGFSAKNQPLLFMHWAKASSVIPLLNGFNEVSECTSLIRISRHERRSCSNSPSPASGFAQYKSGAQAERNMEKRLMPIQFPKPW